MTQQRPTAVYPNNINVCGTSSIHGIDRWKNKAPVLWAFMKAEVMLYDSSIFHEICTRLHCVLLWCNILSLSINVIHLFISIMVTYVNVEGRYGVQSTSDGLQTQSKGRIIVIHVYMFWVYCNSLRKSTNHDDVMKWKHFPRYWPFVRWIPRSPVNFPHKCQSCRVLMFSLICVWINGWVNHRESSDLRRRRAQHDVIVMNATLSWPEAL